MDSLAAGRMCVWLARAPVRRVSAASKLTRVSVSVKLKAPADSRIFKWLSTAVF
jgi:hypothetical protein